MNNTIQYLSFVCTQWGSYKYCYSTQFIYLHKVKWFQILLYITNNSIKHQSFVHSISSNLIWSKSFVCTQFKCQTILFDTYIGLYQMLPVQLKVDLRAIVILMEVCMFQDLHIFKYLFIVYFLCKSFFSIIC